MIEHAGRSRVWSARWIMHVWRSQDPNTVRQALVPDQVLVELVRYQHHLGRGKLEPKINYGALVMRAEGEQ